MSSPTGRERRWAGAAMVVLASGAVAVPLMPAVISAETRPGADSMCDAPSPPDVSVSIETVPTTTEIVGDATDSSLVSEIATTTSAPIDAVDMAATETITTPGVAASVPPVESPATSEPVTRSGELDRSPTSIPALGVRYEGRRVTVDTAPPPRQIIKVEMMLVVDQDGKVSVRLPLGGNFNNPDTCRVFPGAELSRGIRKDEWIIKLPELKGRDCELRSVEVRAERDAGARLTTVGGNPAVRFTATNVAPQVSVDVVLECRAPR